MSLTPGIPEFPTSDMYFEQMRALYDDATVNLIVKALPQTLPDFSRDEFVGSIRNWAAGYLYAKENLDVRRPAAIKKSAQKLHEAIETLLTCIHKTQTNSYLSILAYWPEPEHKGSGLFGPATNNYAIDLEITKALRTIRSLMQAAEMCDSSLTVKRGAKPKISRRLAVGALAYEYHAATGELPTRRYDAHKEEFYGPFRNFVVAAFHPIDGDEAEKGIDRVIQNVLTVRR